MFHGFKAEPTWPLQESYSKAVLTICKPFLESIESLQTDGSFTDHPALRDWCLDGERLTLENIAGLFQEWDQSNSNPSFNASKLFLMTDPRDSGTPIVSMRPELGTLGT